MGSRVSSSAKRSNGGVKSGKTGGVGKEASVKKSDSGGGGSSRGKSLWRPETKVNFPKKYGFIADNFSSVDQVSLSLPHPKVKYIYNFNFSTIAS